MQGDAPKEIGLCSLRTGIERHISHRYSFDMRACGLAISELATVSHRDSLSPARGASLRETQESYSFPGNRKKEYLSQLPCLLHSRSKSQSL